VATGKVACATSVDTEDILAHVSNNPVMVY